MKEKQERGKIAWPGTRKHEPRGNWMQVSLDPRAREGQKLKTDEEKRLGLDYGRPYMSSQGVCTVEQRQW